MRIIYKNQTPERIRLSIGLEDAEDLISDLEQELVKAAEARGCR